MESAEANSGTKSRAKLSLLRPNITVLLSCMTERGLLTQSQRATKAFSKLLDVVSGHQRFKVRHGHPNQKECHSIFVSH